MLVLVSFLPVHLRAQTGWDIVVGAADTAEQFYAAVQLPNGDFIVGGGKHIPAYQYWKPYTAYVTRSGQVLWTKEYAAGDSSLITSMQILPGGNILATLGGGYRGGVMLLDAGGNLQWANPDVFPSVPYTYRSVKDVALLPNGDMMVAGSMGFDAAIARLDSNGDTLWTRKYASDGYGNEIERTASGNFLVVYDAAGFGVGVREVSPSGVTLSNRLFSNRLYQGKHCFIPLSSGNYALGVAYTDFGGSYSNEIMILNAQGDSLSHITIEEYMQSNINYFTITSLEELNPTTFMVQEQNQSQTAPECFRIRKMFTNGTTVFTAQYDRVHDDPVWPENFGHCMLHDSWGQGYLFAGYVGNAAQVQQGWVIFADDSGFNNTNRITGNVFADANGNCIFEAPNDIPTDQVLMQLLPDTAYTLCDQQGNYVFYVDSGTFQVQPIVHPGFIPSLICPSAGSHTVYFSANNYLVSDSNDFVYTKDTCYNLQVDLNTGIGRLCSDGLYTLSVCNNGFYPVPLADIRLVFDSDYIQITGSTLSYSILGDTAFFTLANLQPGMCYPVWINVQYTCDINAMGFTNCAIASVTPGISCFSGGPGWDHSFIQVLSECTDDTTVTFTIRNNGVNGIGDMDAPRNFIVYEDNILYLTQPYNLTGGQSTQVAYVRTGGTTVTGLARQHPQYPFGVFAVSSVEGCGTPAFSTGFVTQFPLEDMNPSISTDCNEIIAGYDPNDKTVNPEGFGSQGFIDENIQRLFYRIRFQNTGTDTAFNIVLVDSLSPYLVPGSLQVTGASHPYTVSIGSGDVLRFNFANIMLPDSNVNEPLSHGYVHFNLALQPGLAPGTQITNEAGIYFDFNPVVLTNTTLNTIAEDVYAVVGVEEIQPQDYAIWPNPFNSLLHVKLYGAAEGHYHLVLFDMLGRKVLESPIFDQPQFTVPCQLESHGIYMYTIYKDTRPVASGKLIRHGQ